jgi:hypothetical protein
MTGTFGDLVWVAALILLCPAATALVLGYRESQNETSRSLEPRASGYRQTWEK